MSENPKYEITKSLGHGAFGHVYLAIEKETKTKLAIKRIIKKNTKLLSREFQVLETLQGSTHSIQLIECFFTQENANLVQNLVFPFFENNLEKFIHKNKLKKIEIEEKQLKLIYFQILIGLQQISDKNLIHRDLKPENILMNSSGWTVLADFGSSKYYDKNKPSTPYMGSQYYRAPELFLGYSDYSYPVDVWAAGCIFIELKIGQPVFKGRDEEDQLFKIIELLGKISEVDLREMEEDAGFSISKLKMAQKSVSDNQEKMNAIYQEFERESIARDFFQKIFQFNPKNRFSAKQLIEHQFFAGIQKDYDDLSRKLNY